jgi:AcrR family transcriptional regulator
VSTKRAYTSEIRTESAMRTRLAILDSAERLFADQGYSATRLPQIAAGARVMVNTIYTSIGGKKELVDAIVDRYVCHEVVLEALRDIDEAATVDDLLRRLVAGVRRSYEIVLGPALIVIDAARTDPAAAPALERMAIPFRTRLRHYADRCCELHAGARLDAELLSQVFWFYLGYGAWQELGAFGWSREAQEHWILRQLDSAVADLSIAAPQDV